MSLLKEQWGLMQRMRAGKTPSPGRSLRSFSPRQPHSLSPAAIQVKPEFEAFRAKVQSRMAAIQDISIGLKKEPLVALTKQFLFGLNGKRVEREEKKEKKAANDRGEIKSIDQVARLQNTSKLLSESVEDMALFEQNSIAHKSCLSNYVENPDKDLTFAADIGPVARSQAALWTKDVVSLGSFPLDAFSKLLNTERLEFMDVANVCLGRIPYKRLREQLHLPSEKPQKVLSITIETPQSDRAPTTRAKAAGKTEGSPGENRWKSKSEVPELLEHAGEMGATVNKQALEGEVEVRIAELMTTIRESESDGTEKVNKLMEQLHRELNQARSEHDRLKARLLIQFLVEYQRVKGAKGGKKTHLKPAVPRVRRTPQATNQPRFDPAEYYYSPSGSHDPFHLDGESSRRSRVRKESQGSGSSAEVKGVLVTGGKRSYANATAASTSRVIKKAQETTPVSLWIGGTRHQAEFDDPNWVSPPEDLSKRKTQPRQVRDKGL